MVNTSRFRIIVRIRYRRNKAHQQTQVVNAECRSDDVLFVIYRITLRKVRLILGKTSLVVLETACSQKLLVVPAMIRKDP